VESATDGVLDIGVLTRIAFGVLAEFHVHSAERRSRLRPSPATSPLSELARYH
jgi:hypothetical protein